MSPDEYSEFSLEQPLMEHWRKYLDGKTFVNLRLSNKEDELTPLNN